MEYYCLQSRFNRKKNGLNLLFSVAWNKEQQDFYHYETQKCTVIKIMQNRQKNKLKTIEIYKVYKNT